VSLQTVAFAWQHVSDGDINAVTSPALLLLASNASMHAVGAGRWAEFDLPTGSRG
jgi:hypothetical protein